jgi:LacI family transcriptional regulator
LTDIAKEAEVSVATVSRVLNGKAVDARISEKRALQIREMARNLGYRPNAAARATRQGRFNAVALLVGRRWSVGHLAPSLTATIEREVERRGLKLFLARLPDAKLSDERFMPRILRELSTDGLLVTYDEQVPQAMPRLIRRYAIPSVWLNCRIDADCVYPDERGAGRRAAEHLLSLGHRRIAYSDFPRSRGIPDDAHYSVFDRRAGVAEALRTSGLAPLPGIQRQPGQGHDLHALFAAANRYLESPDRPTAVVAYASPEAQALAVAALRLGLRVPEDLSVVAFTRDRDYALDLPLTAMVIPESRMGELAVARLMGKIEQPAGDGPPRAQVVEHEFSGGATCAPLAT